MFTQNVTASATHPPGWLFPWAGRITPIPSLPVGLHSNLFPSRHTDTSSAAGTHQTPIPWHFSCSVWKVSYSSFIQGGWVFRHWICKGRDHQWRESCKRMGPSVVTFNFGVHRRNRVCCVATPWWLFYQFTHSTVPSQDRLSRCFVYSNNLLGLAGILGSIIRPDGHILDKSSSYSLSF